MPQPSFLATLTFLAVMATSLCCLDAREVRYKDFGAVGDGKTDDFEALVKAHDYANEKMLPVKADANATYYISGADKTIVVMTDTDFGNASFIIDDTNLKNHRTNVFDVRSEQKSITLKGLESLRKGQPRINVNLPSACLISVTNSKVKHFIRRGGNQNNGSDQKDTFLTDQRGKIDPNTPIIWDFDHISKAVAYPIDEKTLTIKGGQFTTIAYAKENTNYHSRGIKISRSNVTVDGVKHLIKGEGKTGPPYSGFISISNCANVTVRDTVFTGRKVYYKIGNAGTRTPMGTYGLSISSALNVSLIRCTQSNDIMDRSIWGIMGTNHCKNLTLDECKLSRFDAHQGVTNATIRNSTLGYMGVKLTGFGNFLIENTTVKAPDFINLRPDYGSTWDGEIIIRNCRFEPHRVSNDLSIISGSNDGQHDFGYTTHLPSKVVIDKLHIADSKNNKGYKGPAILGNFNPRMRDASYKQAHPQVITKLIAHRGIEIASGKPLRISDNTFMFRNVKVHE